MTTIVDFNCTYDNAAGICKEVTEQLNLSFPEAYVNAESMVILARALKEHSGTPFCEMPFCHTLEAEAMGGIINYGDEKTGPRVKAFRCTSLDEVLELPEMDFTKGRMHQVLLACKMLIEMGEPVVLDVSGPFTILNSLIDAKYIFRGMRKTPELVSQILKKLDRELRRFIAEAEKYGVKMISYADSAGGLQIVGPKVAEQITDDFTYGFLKTLEKETKSETTILLCPKTTFMLLGTEKAVFEDIKLEREMYYGEACVAMCGTVKFAGQMCIKNTQYKLKNKVFKKVTIL